MISILDQVRSASKRESKNYYDSIRTYTRDFFMSDEDVISVINKKAKGDTFEQKSKNFLDEILNIKRFCIDKAAQNDKALKSYQLKALDYMLTNRGMVAAFEMGSGKTLTAVVISYCIIKLAMLFDVDKDFRIMMIVPPSLEENMIKEMISYKIGRDEDDVVKHYMLYKPQTLSNHMNKGIIDCKKSLVIIDEAHNMRKDFSGNFTITIKDQSSKPGRVENMVFCSVDSWKVLLLTGTPLYNSTVDIVNLAAMVKGQMEPSDIDPYVLLQNDRKAFDDYYRNIFLFHKNDHDLFPQRKDIVVNIIMNREVLQKYEELESISEKEIDKGGKPKRGRGRPSSDEGDIDQKFEVTKKDGRGRNAYMAPLRTSVNNITPNLKCRFMTEKIKDALTRNEKCLIFSDFKEAGAGTIQWFLKTNGIKSTVVDGDLEIKLRDIYVERFNKDLDMVLIVTRVGGEGFDLKGVRHIFAFEKNWNIATMEQYIGRGIRYKSHEHLPPDQRNVTVYHLMLIKPSDYHHMPKNIIDYSENQFVQYENNSINIRTKYPNKASVDIYMFCRALDKQQKIDVLLKELQRIQIGSDEQ